MNNCILVLEKEPSSEGSINELFRHAHSVKGMAASMGYSKIAELSHRLEDMMDTVRRGETSIDSSMTDILLDGMDILESLVDAVEQDQDPAGIETDALLAKLMAVTEGGEPAEEAEAPAVEAAPEPQAAQATPESEPASEIKLKKGELHVKFQIAPDCVVPCARAYLAVKKLGDLGKVKSCQPGVEEIKAGNCDGGVVMVLAGADPESVNSALEGLAEMGPFSVTAGDKAASAAAKKKPRAEPAAKAPEKKAAKKEPPPAEPEAAPPAPEAAAAKPPAAPTAKTVRISTALLDTFINLVGELIVTKSRLADLLGRTESRTVDQVMTRLDHLVGGLHGEVMKVRMTALETVTQRLPRVVRDLARKSGKKVSLEIEGAQIELDRAILEEISDPLIHILRNSVDHGVEAPDERKKDGKDETGRIYLNAFRERDMVHIEVRDDGRGMNLERIRQKAVEKGLISADQAKVISDEETVMLVCRPGFSTAEQVTDVSGRGVGMDVVQSAVEALGGSLSIESRTGEGTTFTLRLPLTVAIVKMLLVKLTDHLFAIPITRVVRTVRVSPDEINESQGKQYLPIGDDLISLYELGHQLQVDVGSNGRELTTVVLVEAINRTVGIVVDGVAGQVDIVVKPLCYPLQYLKRYSGMTVLGDGRIVPILDLGNLV
jgi:two-component system chemotaxis sensor kinase CheA